MVPPLQSLVKYDNAVLVSSAKEKKVKDKLLKVPLVVSATRRCYMRGAILNVCPTLFLQSGGLLPGEHKTEAPQTEDILNSILPPRSSSCCMICPGAATQF